MGKEKLAIGDTVKKQSKDVEAKQAEKEYRAVLRKANFEKLLATAKPRGVLAKGKWFPSVRAVAICYGFNEKHFDNLVRKMGSVDAAIDYLQNDTTIQFRGKSYGMAKDLALAYGISTAYISTLKKTHGSYVDGLEYHLRNKRPLIHCLGRTFSDFKSVETFCGFPRGTLRTATERLGSVEKALSYLQEKQKDREVWVHGERYPDATALASAYGINVVTFFCSRQKHGSAEAAIDYFLEKRKGLLKCLGQRYHTHQHLADSYGFKLSHLYSAIKHQKSLDAAVNYLLANREKKKAKAVKEYQAALRQADLPALLTVAMPRGFVCHGKWYETLDHVAKACGADRGSFSSMYYKLGSIDDAFDYYLNRQPTKASRRRKKK